MTHIRTIHDNKGSTTIIITVIIVLVLLLLIGGLYFYRMQNSLTSAYPDTGDGTDSYGDTARLNDSSFLNCENPIPPMTKDVCWKFRSVAESNAELCKNISGAEDPRRNTKEICISDIANVTGNTALCDMIQDSTKRANCVSFRGN